MKAVKSGRVYDTEKATLVGEWSTPVAANDFHYMHEALYRKRAGEYFIHGEGHAMTKYASHEYGGWTWGEEIVPVSMGEAREWAEKHLEADDYLAEFEPEPEDDAMTQISFNVRRATRDAIERECRTRGITRGQVVDLAVAAAFGGISR